MQGQQVRDIARFTPKEQDIADLLLEYPPMTYGQMARKLHIADRTLKTHFSNMLEKRMCADVRSMTVELMHERELGSALIEVKLVSGKMITRPAKSKDYEDALRRLTLQGMPAIVTPGTLERLQEFLSKVDYSED